MINFCASKLNSPVFFLPNIIFSAIISIQIDLQPNPETKTIKIEAGLLIMVISIFFC